MFGEFKDAENAKNSNEDKRAAASRALAVSLRLLNDKNNEVGNNGHQVEHVHNVFEEL